MRTLVAALCLISAPSFANDSGTAASDGTPVIKQERPGIEISTTGACHFVPCAPNESETSAAQQSSAKECELELAPAIKAFARRMLSKDVRVQHYAISALKQSLADPNAKINSAKAIATSLGTVLLSNSLNSETRNEVFDLLADPRIASAAEDAITHAWTTNKFFVLDFLNRAKVKADSKNGDAFAYLRQWQLRTSIFSGNLATDPIALKVALRYASLSQDAESGQQLFESLKASGLLEREPILAYGLRSPVAADWAAQNFSTIVSPSVSTYHLMSLYRDPLPPIAREQNYPQFGKFLGGPTGDTEIPVDAKSQYAMHVPNLLSLRVGENIHMPTVRALMDAIRTNTNPFFVEKCFSVLANSIEPKDINSDTDEAIELLGITLELTASLTQEPSIFDRFKTRTTYFQSEIEKEYRTLESKHPVEPFLKEAWKLFQLKKVVNLEFASEEQFIESYKNFSQFRKLLKKITEDLHFNERMRGEYGGLADVLNPEFVNKDAEIWQFSQSMDQLSKLFAQIEALEVEDAKFTALRWTSEEEQPIQNLKKTALPTLRKLLGQK